MNLVCGLVFTQGLSRDLKKFAALLEAGNARRAESEKFHQAATVIQAIYRGFKTRQSLKKANTAFSRFQRSFRLVYLSSVSCALSCCTSAVPDDTVLYCVM